MAEEKVTEFQVENASASLEKQGTQQTGNGTVQLFAADGEFRLVPVPSQDPNDPLRLPEWRKWMILATVCLFSAAGMTAANSIASIIPNLEMYYTNPAYIHGPPPSSQSISQLGTFPSLFIGIGAIMCTIAAQAVGTRPVMIFEAALVATCIVWAAVSRGKDRGLYSHIASRCILGLGAGAGESLVPLIMQDINYLHKRNSRLSLIWASGGIASSAMGSAASYIVTDIGWRWYYWILFIFSAISLSLIIIFTPETTWPRTVEDLNGISRTDADGFAEPVRPSGHDKSYWYSVRLYSEHAGKRAAWLSIMDLIRSAIFPNIIWLVFLNACFIGVTVSASLVIGTLLIEGWYWEPQNVGLLQVPLAVGSIIAIPIIGIGGDWVISKMATRNGGIHEPEHQLVNMILPFIVGFLGTVCFGIVCSNPEKYHWILPLLFMGFMFFSLIATNVITTTYAIGCFPDLAPSMVIIVGSYRNIIGFGISYGVDSFVAKAGYNGAFGTYAGIMGLLGLTSFYFYFGGKALRQRMNNWPFRYSRVESVAHWRN
ncbi:major facilitator superfamily domain-containing protein [Leptodontidium sp. MPI-SDFR-AT-0119]|nr:major facilitator superfamily domain-containing protein [Leptodontidium sp. MPI-SDFR-AT-0119]